MSDLESALSRNIRDFRKRLDITQDQLAKEIGFSSSQIMSQIEKGEREVKAWELFRIAKALHSNVDELLSEQVVGPLPFVLWRKTPSGNRKLLEAEFVERCKQYHQLEQLCNIKTQYCLPIHPVNFSTMTFREAGRLGKRVWKELELGSRPASCLANILENKYAVKIWFQDLGEGGSAASTRDSFGDGILMNSNERPWRRNYNFGHELFHLVTWGSITADYLIKDKMQFDERVERLAEIFASSLLLPEDEIVQEFEVWQTSENTALSDIVALARDFGVSTSALLWRLCNLGYMESNTVESLLDDERFKALDRVLRADSKEDDLPPIPERFVRLGFLAYQRGKLSRALFADYLKVSLADLSQFLLKYGLDDTKDYQTTIPTLRH